MMRRRIGVLAVLVCASLTWVAAQQKNTDWATYGLDYYEQRFSTLDQINTRNVATLQKAWTFHTGDKTGFFESTPLVVDVNALNLPGMHAAGSAASVVMVKA